MFASFTHHLCTTFILFYRNGTHWTALDQIIIENHHRFTLPIGGQQPRVFFTSQRLMPLKIINRLFIFVYNLKSIKKLTGFLHPEQKSSLHVGQCTALGN
jgi:hypothetical protein